MEYNIISWHKNIVVVSVQRSVCLAAVHHLGILLELEHEASGFEQSKTLSLDLVNYL